MVPLIPPIKDHWIFESEGTHKRFGTPKKTVLGVACEFLHFAQDDRSLVKSIFLRELVSFLPMVLIFHTHLKNSLAPRPLRFHLFRTFPLGFAS